MFNEVLNFHYAQNTALFMMLYYTDTVWSVKVSLEGYYLPDKDISLDICDHWSRKLSLQDPVSVTWASQSGLNVRLCSTGLVHRSCLSDAAVLRPNTWTRCCSAPDAGHLSRLAVSARLVWSGWGLPFSHRKKPHHSRCFRATSVYA